MKRWVFIRGLARESDHWGDFLERCQQALGWQCICVDIPGSGDHYLLDTPKTVTEIREQLQQQLQRQLANLNLQVQAEQQWRSFGVLGLSLGGMIALDWAQADVRVERLILINSSSRLSPLWQRLKLTTLTTLLPAIAAKEVATRERKALSLVSNTHASDPRVLAHWLDIQARRPVTRCNILRMLLAAALYKPRVWQSQAEVLIVASRADRLVSYLCSEALHQHMSSTLLLHQNAGHDLPLDDPGWLIEEFRCWCRGEKLGH